MSVSTWVRAQERCTSKKNIEINDEKADKGGGRVSSQMPERGGKLRLKLKRWIKTEQQR